MARNNELECVFAINNFFKGASNLKLVASNCDAHLIEEAFKSAVSNDKEYEFPDFLFRDGLIEHFIVTSSTEDRGADFKKFEAKSNKQNKKYFDEKDQEFLKSNPESQTLYTVSRESKYSKNNYSNFLTNFKTHFDSHLHSLFKSGIKNKIAIFLIENQGGRLCVYENERFKEFYILSHDKNILKYLKNNKQAVNYIVFISADSFEIIDTSKIDDLLVIAKEGLDIRGGSITNIELKLYIDL